MEIVFGHEASSNWFNAFHFFRHMLMVNVAWCTSLQSKNGDKNHISQQHKRIQSQISTKAGAFGLASSTKLLSARSLFTLQKNFSFNFLFQFDAFTQKLLTAQDGLTTGHITRYRLQIRKLNNKRYLLITNNQKTTRRERITFCKKVRRTFQATQIIKYYIYILYTFLCKMRDRDGKDKKTHQQLETSLFHPCSPFLQKFFSKWINNVAYLVEQE